MKIQFTTRPITAWGGLASIVVKLLEVVEVRTWVESAIPIEERSNNAKGVYEKGGDFQNTMIRDYKKLWRNNL